MPGGQYSPLHEDGISMRNFSQNLNQDSTTTNNSSSNGIPRFNFSDDILNNNSNNSNDANIPITHCIDSSETTTMATSLSDERFDVNGRTYPSDISGPAPPSSPSRHRNPRHPQSPGTRYTALRPTSVTRLDNHGDDPYDPFSLPDASDSEPDLDLYDSQVRISPSGHDISSNRRRFHVIMSGLLVAMVSTVVFGILYVFVILPAHKGQVVGPGGRPSAQMFKLKHLGENVAVTSCGLVQGTYENGAHVFRGIPYAFPPTGSLRWKMPVPLKHESDNCWKDTLNTTSFGNVCTQPLIPKYVDKNSGRRKRSNVENSDLEVTGSEDCLYLNVWTPSLNPPELLPVLVWIHSGDFVYGSGHARGMTPTPDLAHATKAVYVSFNFRLGVFGFLSLDVLRERGKLPRGATGNYGIMDQQLALRWVKDNIRNFGGDSNRVTLFGHGSGATSIQALLLSPASTGLFTRAWMTSPVALLNKTLAQACEDNQPLLTRSGCSDADCLRGLDPKTLVELSPWSLDPYRTLGQLLASPRHSQARNGLAIFDGGLQDGHVIHWDSIKHGPTGPTVPVVIGASYSDLTGLRTNLPVNNLTWDQLDTVLVDQLSPLGTDTVLQIKSLYSQHSKAGYSVQNPPSPTTDGLSPLPSLQLARLVRDVQVVCPSKLLADRLNSLYARSAPVYLYISEAFPSHELRLKKHSSLSSSVLSLRSSSSTRSSSSSPKYTSSKSSEKDMTSADEIFIGWDMVALFGTFGEFDFRVRQGDISFQDIVRQELLSLARDGKPNAARWRTESVNTGILRSEVTVTPAPEGYFDNCESLRQLGFFRYTWTDNTGS